jgi:hypothetical protein
LKTYLPDGDIDLTVFGINQILPETFIPKILQKLESEINNEFAKFRVKEVQFIQAEVCTILINFLHSYPMQCNILLIISNIN